MIIFKYKSFADKTYNSVEEINKEIERLIGLNKKYGNKKNDPEIKRLKELRKNFTPNNLPKVPEIFATKEQYDKAIEEAKKVIKSEAEEATKKAVENSRGLKGMSTKQKVLLGAGSAAALSGAGLIGYGLKREQRYSQRSFSLRRKLYADYEPEKKDSGFSLGKAALGAGAAFAAYTGARHGMMGNAMRRATNNMHMTIGRNLGMSGMVKSGAKNWAKGAVGSMNSEAIKAAGGSELLQNSLTTSMINNQLGRAGGKIGDLSVRGVTSGLDVSNAGTNVMESLKQNSRNGGAGNLFKNNGTQTSLENQSAKIGNIDKRRENIASAREKSNTPQQQTSDTTTQQSGTGNNNNQPTGVGYTT